jgi:NAD(P)-dependent dehydrogenase (short-subunit alcohol dehydrogenase family)
MVDLSDAAAAAERAVDAIIAKFRRLDVLLNLAGLSDGKRLWAVVAGMGAYTASKAAVHRLTESLAEELKDKGVIVNVALSIDHRHAGQQMRYAGCRFRKMGKA